MTRLVQTKFESCYCICIDTTKGRQRTMICKGHSDTLTPRSFVPIFIPVIGIGTQQDLGRNIQYEILEKLVTYMWLETTVSWVYPRGNSKSQNKTTKMLRCWRKKCSIQASSRNCPMEKYY